ncbi:hypothetical protein GCM10023225_22010 [Kineococcus glutinatus]|uniref:PIN domain-containing protein n=1 Tax=Kineococcus glutinatus TaxID=1070872 RepID=A0ABP9HYE2_9ACTN
MSAANWAELLEIAERRGLDITPIRELVTVVGFDAVEAEASTRYTSPGISLGDRCCLATAWVRRVAAVTADRSWSERFGDAAVVRQVRGPAG